MLDLTISISAHDEEGLQTALAAVQARLRAGDRAGRRELASHCYEFRTRGEPILTYAPLRRGPGSRVLPQRHRDLTEALEAAPVDCAVAGLGAGDAVLVVIERALPPGGPSEVPA